MAERVVRFTPQFFERLDELLPAERSPEGAPSTADFLLYDLPRIRDQLADNFEGNTLPADEEPVRVWVGSGMVAERARGWLSDRQRQLVLWTSGSPGEAMMYEARSIGAWRWEASQSSKRWCPLTTA
jgi:hypothetical protein